MAANAFRIPWSESAASFARHRANKYPAVFQLPERCPDRFNLRALSVGLSHRFGLGSYTKADLVDLRAQVTRFNRSYPMQFKVFKTRTFIEVARIA